MEEIVTISKLYKWGVRALITLSLLGSTYFATARFSHEEGPQPAKATYYNVESPVPPTAKKKTPEPDDEHVLAEEEPVVSPRKKSSAQIDDVWHFKFSLLEIITYVSSFLTGVATIYVYGIKPIWGWGKELITTINLVKKIAYELAPNGGGSLYDSIKTMALQTSKAEGRHKALIDSLNIVRFESNDKGECIWISAAYSELLGISKEEAKGNGWLVIIHNDDRDRVMHSWIDAISQKREFRLIYRAVNRITQVEYKVYCTAVPLMAMDGSGPVGYIGSITPLEGPGLERYRCWPATV